MERAPGCHTGPCAPSASYRRRGEDSHGGCHVADDCIFPQARPPRDSVVAGQRAKARVAGEALALRSGRAHPPDKQPCGPPFSWPSWRPRRCVSTTRQRGVMCFCSGWCRRQSHSVKAVEKRRGMPCSSRCALTPCPPRAAGPKLCPESGWHQLADFHPRGDADQLPVLGCVERCGAALRHFRHIASGRIALEGCQATVGGAGQCATFSPRLMGCEPLPAGGWRWLSLCFSLATNP